jgi:hypothetical protein
VNQAARFNQKTRNQLLERMGCGSFADRMDIFQTTTRYETWLAQTVPVIADHLTIKHNLMKESAFAFFRGTYYHWTEELSALQLSGVECPSVGDLHIENFGTWRDAEGRLVWGVNDYDEAAMLPWQNDVLRLLTSALLALDADCLELKPGEIVESILAGYRKGLMRGPRIYTLAERNDWLRELVKKQTKNPDSFFEKLTDQPGANPPEEVKALLTASLPPDAQHPLFVLREAGMGSLGKARYAAIATWNGGLIAREARAVCPPAQNAFGKAIPALGEEILAKRKSSPDPFRRLEGSWLIRRLAPDCAKVEMELLERQADQAKLLAAMGRETASVHHSGGNTEKILEELNAANDRWFRETAGNLADAVRSAFKSFRKRTRTGRDSVD